jgi:hypothetical protein
VGALRAVVRVPFGGRPLGALTRCPRDL